MVFFHYRMDVNIEKRHPLCRNKKSYIILDVMASHITSIFQPSSSTNICRRRPALAVVRLDPGDLLLQTLLHLRCREQLLRQPLVLRFLVRELVIRLALGAGLLPAVDGVVDAHGCDADAEDVHQDGLVALAPSVRDVCRVGRPGVPVGFLAVFVGFGRLVDVVRRGDSGDSGEAGVDVLLVA